MLAKSGLTTTTNRAHKEFARENKELVATVLLGQVHSIFSIKHNLTYLAKINTSTYNTLIASSDSSRFRKVSASEFVAKKLVPCDYKLYLSNEELHHYWWGSSLQRSWEFASQFSVAAFSQTLEPGYDLQVVSNPWNVRSQDSRQ